MVPPTRIILISSMISAKIWLISLCTWWTKITCWVLIKTCQVLQIWGWVSLPLCALYPSLPLFLSFPPVILKICHLPCTPSIFRFPFPWYIYVPVKFRLAPCLCMSLTFNRFYWQDILSLSAQSTGQGCSLPVSLTPHLSLCLPSSSSLSSSSSSLSLSGSSARQS